jgi:hypothetical protein
MLSGCESLFSIELRFGADQGGLAPESGPLDCVLHLSTNVCLEASQIFDGFGGQYDFVTHSGQILARFDIVGK